MITESSRSTEQSDSFSKELEESLTSSFDDKPSKSPKSFDQDDYGFIPSKDFPFSDGPKPSKFQAEENDYEDDDIILTRPAPPSPLEDEKSDEKEEFETEYEAFKYYGHKRGNDDRSENRNEENSGDERSEDAEDNKSEEKDSRKKYSKTGIASSITGIFYTVKKFGK